MRRVTAVLLASAAVAARTATAPKQGDVTDLFAEPIAPLPACVAPAAAPPPLPAEAPRPAWRDRLAARFRRAPRAEQSASDPRLERFQMRRLGLD